jgi:hypothetical protein
LRALEPTKRLQESIRIGSYASPPFLEIDPQGATSIYLEGLFYYGPDQEKNKRFYWVYSLIEEIRHPEFKEIKSVFTRKLMTDQVITFNFAGNGSHGDRMAKTLLEIETSPYEPRCK